MSTTRASTLVIGGGPAGLVSLKYILEYGPSSGEDEPPILVEMEGDIGDFRYPLSAPDHPSLPNFVDYLHRYADHFGLTPHIRLKSKVVRLEKVAVGEYKHRATVRMMQGEKEGEEYTIIAKRIIITTGLHVTPNIPSIPGLTASTSPKSPPYIHSSSYKSRSQVKDKSVLVLGAGETGMDVAYESVLSPASKVWMGVRNGFLSFPKVLNNFRVLGSTFDGNLPIDGLITNLFETAYVHPWVAASHLRWFVSDFVIRRVLYVLTGTQAGCNQWAGELPPERQGRAYVFLNKSAKAMQFINRPHYKLSRLHRMVAHYIDPPLPSHVKDPTIHMVPSPTSFDESGRAIFPSPPEHRKKETAWKEECRPDLVVLCTGYKQEWGWLEEGYATPDQCDLRGVCHSGDLSVAYIGFLRPGVGAIPPMAEMQAQFFLLLTTGRIQPPSTPENYHLLHAREGRIQYGVDYSTYMATLARDMGSAPSLAELLWQHGPFVTFIYCFGAAFPTFYRLVGAFKSASAPRIVKTELWDTIKRRGVIGNIFMGVIPMAFYAIVNLFALMLEIGWTLVAPLLGYSYSPSYRAEKTA